MIFSMRDGYHGPMTNEGLNLQLPRPKNGGVCRPTKHVKRSTHTAKYSVIHLLVVDVLCVLVGDHAH